MFEQKEKSNPSNVFIRSLKALISFIPPPGKVYMLIHAMIIVQAVIVSMRALYMGSWAVLMLMITLPMIIISALCMTAIRVWLIAFLSSLIGMILFLWVAIQEESMLEIWPLFIIYIYSTLSAFSGWRIKKEKYTLRTFKMFNRKLPFGLFLLTLNSIIQPALLLYYFIQKQDYLSELSLLNKISLLPRLATIILLPCIIYFLFKHKKMHTLICLAVLASYEILLFIGNMFSFNVYMTPDIFFSFIPLMFICYIKTSKDAEVYFLSSAQNNENGSKHTIN